MRPNKNKEPFGLAEKTRKVEPDILWTQESIGFLSSPR